MLPFTYRNTCILAPKFRNGPSKLSLKYLGKKKRKEEVKSWWEFILGSQGGRGSSLLLLAGLSERPEREIMEAFDAPGICRETAESRKPRRLCSSLADSDIRSLRIHGLNPRSRF